MNKRIKTILLIVGVLLLIYGGYQVVTPEASVDLGIAEFETQNNNNAYIAMGAGIVTLLVAVLVKNK